MKQQPPRSLPVLQTARLVIRLPRREDAPAIAAFLLSAREAFRPTEPTRPEEYFTEGFWREHSERVVQDFVRDQGARFFVFSRASGLPIGLVNLNQIVRGALQGCTLGYALDPAEQGKGLMTEGLRAVIDYAFGELNLHRIMAGYMPHNSRSAAVLQRLGFVIEGQARDYIRIDGEWRDHVLTSLVNPAWRDPSQLR
jgi:ribosomal-protein-alanine N-acetyltransferase